MVYSLVSLALRQSVVLGLPFLVVWAQSFVSTQDLMYMMNLGWLLCQHLRLVSSILACLRRTDLLTVVVAPYQLPRHYPYCSDRCYSVLCFLEQGAQVLRVVLVLLVRPEPLLMVMDQTLQMCSLLLVRIDRL